MRQIGFVQGRLSPMYKGRIQAFPWDHWRSEFAVARDLGLKLMEWTLDHERILENPLLTKGGQAEIAALSSQYDVKIPSLTGDCFMQAPWWKATGSAEQELKEEFVVVAEACCSLGISKIVVPLVDNGALRTVGERKSLVGYLSEQENFLCERNLSVLFESDFGPFELRSLIDEFDPETFGINYDIGNSASNGFDHENEIAHYGERIMNVHVKDRLRGGTTVPLGTGAADFGGVFRSLARAGYQGDFILQTARASGESDSSALARYRDLTNEWIMRYAA